jgi:hypothetical protein
LPLVRTRSIEYAPRDIAAIQQTVTMHRLAWTTAVIALTVGVGMAGSGCSQIQLHPGEDVAPSREPARARVAPATVASASETTSGRDELKTLNFQTGQQALGGERYDLPTVIDVALRSNPQSKRAWFLGGFGKKTRISQRILVEAGGIENPSQGESGKKR